MSEQAVALTELLGGAGIELAGEQVKAIELYAEMLADYGSHTNLVADPSPESIFTRHFADSLSILEFSRFFVSDKQCRLADLGTGAGLPGLCLAIALPGLRVDLIDSTAKKTRFVEAAVRRLGLTDRASAVTARLEELAHQDAYRGQFDLVVSRALGHLAVVAELGLPLLRPGGLVLAFKSEEQAGAELRESRRHLKALGGGPGEIVVPALQTSSSGVKHVIVVIEKTGETPGKYPRSWAQIKRLSS